jgi:predicted DNA-binding transcriptional regulator AlpA
MGKSRRLPPRLQTTTQAKADGNASAGMPLHDSKRRPTDPLMRLIKDTNGAIRPERYAEEFWSIGIVARKTGLSRASIYRYIARGLFPDRRSIGPGRVAWLASEVSAWMESRPRLDPV